MNLVDAIRKWSSLTPDNTAIIDATTDRCCTFSGLLDRVTRLANGLSELGLTRGDRVAVLSTNSIEYFEVYYACAMAGFIAQPINWRLSPEEVARIIEDGEPSAFLCHSDFLELRNDVVKRLSIDTTCLEYGPGADGSFERVIRNASGEPPVNDVGAHDPVLILYTGGTHGQNTQAGAS